MIFDQLVLSLTAPIHKTMCFGLLSSKFLWTSFIFSVTLQGHIWKTRRIQTKTYFSPGRSFTLAVISAASGTSFSTSSRGPQKDLFCPRKVFLAKAIKTKKYFNVLYNINTSSAHAHAHTHIHIHTSHLLCFSGCQNPRLLVFKTIQAVRIDKSSWKKIFFSLHPTLNPSSLKGRLCGLALRKKFKGTRAHPALGGRAGRAGAALSCGRRPETQGPLCSDSLRTSLQAGLFPPVTCNYALVFGYL